MAFFVLYLLMVLEGVQSYLFGVAVISGIVLLTSSLVRLVTYDDDEDAPPNMFPLSSKLLLALCLTTSLLGHMIPSKQDMAIIAAGGITYNIATSDKAAELGNRSIELLSKKLDQMIDNPVEATKEAKAVVKEATK